MFDTIVIGQGPAGISAAIYLKRFNLNPLVIAKDYGALEVNSTIENYYGFKSIDGQELIKSGIEQAKNLGIEIINDEVLDIENYPSLIVKTKNSEYHTKSILLATGKSRSKVFVKGFKDLEGKGISYCATCDGFFYRKKKIGIMGSGNYMLNELNVLRNFTESIIVFSDEDLDIPEKVVKDKIIEFYGEENLEGVKTIKEDYKLDGMFIAIGSQNGATFAKHLGMLLDENNNIIVNNYMTNLDGIFAAGDVIKGVNQIVKAASDGANAAYAIKEYLKNK